MYLLDTGPDSDRVEIEESLLSDEEMYRSVREIEDELVRDYCRGELSTGCAILSNVAWRGTRAFGRSSRS